MFSEIEHQLYVGLLFNPHTKILAHDNVVIGHLSSASSILSLSESLLLAKLLIQFMSNIIAFIELKFHHRIS
ncbi:MAG: hypothetical protein U9Q66_01050 [Patescibacteria group bacterium]|nr:hypothetical protein [Patescibacteria group bacterium]